MHVVTFYSFKGGVGRSMALVNVGAALAKRGRKVLLVDFDLEAPGLTTFNLARPPKPVPGIVEFVQRYRDEAKAPNVSDYIYESEAFSSSGGQLWVMPAGIQDESYHKRFKAIDWEKLYKDESGYLLLEDLRSQWESTIKPDYVLIDSRTGFTDDAGICTRQLPDAVCLLFFPNEQNLLGIARVVDEIRQQQGRGGSNTKLHYVLSNVPDLDDENEILATTLQKFRDRLGFEEPAATIHHYSSLAILSQAVFVLERDKSRLAQEYIKLSDAIAADNLGDRSAALKSLQQDYAREHSAPRSISIKALTDRLAQIQSLHQTDSEILLWLARLHRRLGQFEDSLALIEAAISAGAPLEAAAEKAVALLLLKKDEQALEALRAVLAAPDTKLPANEVTRLVRLALNAGYKSAEELSAAPTVMSLSAAERLSLALIVEDSEEGRRLGLELAEGVLRDQGVAPEDKYKARRVQMRSLIAGGSLAQAIASGAKDINDAAVPFGNVFHYAMALFWGGDKAKGVDAFKRYLSLAPAERDEPNHYQGIAFAAYAVGDLERAKECLRLAASAARMALVQTFSFWRYKRVSGPLFVADCERMRFLFDGRDERPPYLPVSSP